MITVKALIESSTQSSPDGRHWEPALPYPTVWWRFRVSDAWQVLMGRATAIRQTTKDDLKAREE